jgi:hypothetical protein
MKHVMLMNPIGRFRASLAGLAMIAFVAFGNAQANAADPVNTQTAEIHDLLVAVHELTSYNGSVETAAEHLVAWEQLWTEDATLLVNPGLASEAYKVGREAVINFFMASAIFNNDWIGLTPSFRTKVAIHGDTAQVYLECIFLDATGAIKAQRALHGTVRKSGGKWLFWKMVNEAAKPLFP